MRILDERGPFRLATAGKSEAERVAWFKEHGAEAVRRRVALGNYGDPESVYVNSKFRCSGYVKKKSKKITDDSTVMEWYKQGSFRREWEL